MNSFNAYYLRSVISKKQGGKVKRVCWSCGHKFDGYPKEACPKCGKKHVPMR